jgi:UDP-N-acetyl-D-mannosaminuronate dehydrogenase
VKPNLSFSLPSENVVQIAKGLSVGSQPSAGKPLRSSRIFGLGVTYPDVRRPRATRPRFAVFEPLTASGARIACYDLFVPELRVVARRSCPVHPPTRRYPTRKRVVVFTAHAAVDHARMVLRPALVFDTGAVIPRSPTQRRSAMTGLASGVGCEA